MKILTVIGLILIALGVVGLIFGGISYASPKNVADLGAIQLQVEQEKEAPVSPILCAGAVVMGALLVFLGRRRRTLVSGCWGSFASDI